MKLKRLRQQQGLSRYALAKRARVSLPHVIKIEAGQADPTLGMIQKLAKALGVKPTVFLED